MISMNVSLSFRYGVVGIYPVPFVRLTFPAGGHQ